MDLSKKILIIYKGIPLVYYFSLITGLCVSLYLFCSGYGLTKLDSNKRINLRNSLNRIYKLLVNYWIILFVLRLWDIYLDIKMNIQEV